MVRCVRCSDGFCVEHGAIADIDTFDKLWAAFRYIINGRPVEERLQWLKLLLRRTRHFGVVGSGIHRVADDDPTIHPKATGSFTRTHSPLCQCGDPRRAHDEDGACQYCHCPMYANPD